MKKTIFWIILSILCVLIALPIGTYKGLKMYYKAHDVKPEVTCEITSISYDEEHTLSLRNADYNQEEIEGFDDRYSMADAEMNDFLKNKNNYFVFNLDCKVYNKSKYIVDMHRTKCKNNKNFWVEDVTLNYGFNVLTLEVGDSGDGRIVILAKGLKPDDINIDKKIVSMLKNSDLKVSYQKVYEGLHRYFEPNNTYYTDVIVHQPK